MAPQHELVTRNLRCQWHGPEFAMIGALNALDEFGQIVRQQFIDPPVEIWIVLTAAGLKLQGQAAVAPKKIVSASFVDDPNHSAAHLWSHVNLQVSGFEPDERNTIELQILADARHVCWLPELYVNANQDHTQQGPPQPEILVPSRRLIGVEH